MIASKLFIRVVAADRGRGFLLLVGWDAKVVQATCVHMSTMTLQNREQLETTIARVVKQYTHSEVIDVTADGIKTKLRILFNEPKPGAAPAETEVEAA